MPEFEKLMTPHLRAFDAANHEAFSRRGRDHIEYYHENVHPSRRTGADNWGGSWWYQSNRVHNIFKEHGLSFPNAKNRGQSVENGTTPSSSPWPPECGFVSRSVRPGLGNFLAENWDQ